MSSLKRQPGLRSGAYKFIHIMTWDEKFIPRYIKMIREKFCASDHCFFIIGDVSADFSRNIKDNNIENVQVVTHIGDVTTPLRCLMKRASKVIVHGLFYTDVVFFLLLSRKFLKKTYWVIWGGDLYYHKLRPKNWKAWFIECCRSYVIRKIRGITTTVPGDYDLARQWYKTNALFFQNLMYESHLYRDPVRISTVSGASRSPGLTVLVGNSADPTNNHIAIFERISAGAPKLARVIVPLAYGDRDYATRVVDCGAALFGDKFEPILALQPPDMYNETLNDVDVAIFDHPRQQAMGNIIALLSLGKKVYLRSSITSWRYLRSLGLVVFDVDDLSNLDSLSRTQVVSNISICRNQFNQQQLVAGWQRVFAHEP